MPGTRWLTVGLLVLVFSGCKDDPESASKTPYNNSGGDLDATNVQAALDELHARIAELETNQSQLQGQVATLETDTATHASRLDTVDATLTDHETRVTDAETTLGTHTNLIGSNSSAIADLEDGVATLTTTANSHSTQLADHETRVDDLEIRTNAFQTAYRYTINRLGNTVFLGDGAAIGYQHTITVTADSTAADGGIGYTSGKDLLFLGDSGLYFNLSDVPSTGACVVLNRDANPVSGLYVGRDLVNAYQAVWGTTAQRHTLVIRRTGVSDDFPIENGAFYNVLCF